MIVGCIWRQPCMDLSEFNNDYLNSLIEKLLHEKTKHIIPMRDFSVDALKYIADTSTTQFLDQTYSSSLLPQIAAPARITLIDNILSTDSAENPSRAT